MFPPLVDRISVPPLDRWCTMSRFTRHPCRSADEMRYNGRMAQKEYARIRIDDCDVVLRDLVNGDIEPIVRYWHESDPAFLQGMGVDLNKLVSPDATRQRFEGALERRAGAGRRVVFVAATADRL